MVVLNFTSDNPVNVVGSSNSWKPLPASIGVRSALTVWPVTVSPVTCTVAEPLVAVLANSIE